MAAAASLAAASAPLERENDVGIVDTHQHLWDLKRLRLPWLPREGPLAGDHLLADYLREAEGLGIGRTVYMEVDVAPEQHVNEAQYALRLCRTKAPDASMSGRRKARMVGAVIGGRPASDDFASYVARFRGDRRVKGVRQVLHGHATPQGYCLQPSFVKGVRLLGEMGLVFDVCLPSALLGDAAKLADACPQTRLVLDHCGNPNVQAGVQDSWRRDMGEVAKRPCVVCKISGIVATAKPREWSADTLAPFVRHCREEFGPDRILFGSDWPVCTLAASLRQWVTALREIAAPWPAADRRKLLRDNAVRWYRL